MSIEMQKYDVLIVGTSPLAITEAVYQKVAGNSVLSIDNRSIIGGAWTTVSHEGIPTVEIGCHIWEVEKVATAFLTNFFQLNLQPLTPSPRLIKKGMSIPYDLKMNLSTGKYVVSRLIRFQFRLLRDGMTSPARRFVLFPSKYLYPKGGALELHERVLEKVEEHQLETRLNTHIDEIILSKEGCIVKLKDGDQDISSSKIVLTSLSSIARIQFEDGTEVSPKTRQMDYIHLHLLVKGTIPKRFSYHRLMDDDTIHRVSDMTFQVADEISSNERLICVGIHGEKYHCSTHEELLTSIHAKLIARKLLSKDSSVQQHGFNVFHSYYTDPDLLTEIEERSNGKIEVLRSTSFTYAFHTQREKYKSLI
ncbi:MAG: hypothetical protein ACI837_001329 [Crocinitomicaceae bacterium]|jgi:hypothetical protein